MSAISQDRWQISKILLAFCVCNQLLFSQCQARAVTQCSSAGESCVTPALGESMIEQDLEDLLLQASEAEARMLEVSLLQSASMKPTRPQGSASAGQAVHAQDIVEISSNGTSTIDNSAEGASSRMSKPFGVALDEVSGAVGADSRRRVRVSSPRRRAPPRRRVSSPRRRAPPPSGTGFQSPRRRMVSGTDFNSPRRRSVYDSGGYQRPLNYGYHPYDPYYGGYGPSYGYGPGYYHYHHWGFGIFGDVIFVVILLCCFGPLICMCCGCMCIYEALATCCPCCFPRPRKPASPLMVAEPELPRQQPRVRRLVPPPPVRRSGLGPSRSSATGDVYSNGVAIPRDVARDFLAAVHDEYISGADQAVGRFFDDLESRGYSQQIGDALGQEESVFQNTGDKHRVYNDLASRWGTEPEGSVYSNGVEIPIGVAEDFLAAVIAEYFEWRGNEVQRLFDELNSRGVAQQIGEALAQEEQLFQNAVDDFDRRRTYDNLASRWGMAPEGPVCSNGVEIPRDVARDFLASVCHEYLNYEERAVERLFDELRSRGISQQIGDVLGSEERIFQNTGDREGAYNNLASRWGM